MSGGSELTNVIAAPLAGIHPGTLGRLICARIHMPACSKYDSSYPWPLRRDKSLSFPVLGNLYIVRVWS